MFLNPGVFLHNFNLNIVWSRFFSLFPMIWIKALNTPIYLILKFLISNWRLGILILFISDVALLKRHESWWDWGYRIVQLIERSIVTCLWVNLILSWIIHLTVCILDPILNPWGFFDSQWNFSQGFLTRKGYSAIYMFFIRPGICQFA